MEVQTHVNVCGFIYLVTFFIHPYHGNSQISSWVVLLLENASQLLLASFSVTGCILIAPTQSAHGSDV